MSISGQTMEFLSVLINGGMDFVLNSSCSSASSAAERGSFWGRSIDRDAQGFRRFLHDGAFAAAAHGRAQWCNLGKWGDAGDTWLYTVSITYIKSPKTEMIEMI